MKPQSAKSKGRLLQQLVANGLLGEFPHLCSDDIKSTSMGASGIDVQLSSVAKQSIPFSFECKNQEKINIWASIDQAKTNTAEGTNYAVVFKRNKEKPQVAIAWTTFLKLINPNSNNQLQAEELHKMAATLCEIASNIK